MTAPSIVWPRQIIATLTPARGVYIFKARKASPPTDIKPPKMRVHKYCWTLERIANNGFRISSKRITKSDK